MKIIGKVIRKGKYYIVLDDGTRVFLSKEEFDKIKSKKEKRIFSDMLPIYVTLFLLAIAGVLLIILPL